MAERAIIEAREPDEEKILGPGKWLASEEKHIYRRLDKAASEIEAFTKALKEELPPPKPSGHDCQWLDCSDCTKKWHRIGCPKWFQSCKSRAWCYVRAILCTVLILEAEDAM